MRLCRSPSYKRSSLSWQSVTRSWRTRWRWRLLRTRRRSPSWRSESSQKGSVHLFWCSVTQYNPSTLFFGVCLCGCMFLGHHRWNETPRGRLTRADEGAVWRLPKAAQGEDGPRHGNRCLQVRAVLVVFRDETDPIRYQYWIRSGLFLRYWKDNVQFHVTNLYFVLLSAPGHECTTWLPVWLSAWVSW